MKKASDTVRYTAEQVEALRRRGVGGTDWAKVDSVTEDELEASIAADLDDVHEKLDWSKAIRGLPPRKRDIHIRLDEDVLNWFKGTGRGYQTRINNVLRAFVKSRKHTTP